MSTLNIFSAEPLSWLALVMGIWIVALARREKSDRLGYARAITGVGAIMTGIGGVSRVRGWDLDPLVMAGAILMIAGLVYAHFLEVPADGSRSP